MPRVAMQVMHFDSVPLGAALGMTMTSPFTDPEVVADALTLSKVRTPAIYSSPPPPTLMPEPEWLTMCHPLPLPFYLAAGGLCGASVPAPPALESCGSRSHAECG